MREENDLKMAFLVRLLFDGRITLENYVNIRERPYIEALGLDPDTVFPCRNCNHFRRESEARGPWRCNFLESKVLRPGARCNEAKNHLLAEAHNIQKNIYDDIRNRYGDDDE